MSDDVSLRNLRIFVSYPRGGATHTWAERVQADLSRRGASVWRDTDHIIDGDDWYGRIVDALQSSDVVVGVFGPDSDDSRWQQREVLFADSLGLVVVPVVVGAMRSPLMVADKQPVVLRHEDQAAAAYHSLAQAVLAASKGRTRFGEPPHAEQEGDAPLDAARRREEIAWLNDQIHSALRGRDLQYEPLAAERSPASRVERLRHQLRFDPQVMIRMFGVANSASASETPVHYDDVLDAYRELPRHKDSRLAVIGEPGAGKTFSLQRVALSHARLALASAALPLPIFVRLGLWTRADTPLLVFIEQQLGPLGRHLATWRDQRRALLLLDGLNEIPLPQRASKAREIRDLADDSRWPAVIVSCRERDYTADFRLPFDQIVLQPLSVPQIHRCLQRSLQLVLGAEQGALEAEQRFWEIAGGAALREVWEIWRSAGASFEQFWSAEEVPRSDPAVVGKTRGSQDRLWHTARTDPRSLLRLASNPYLLSLLIALPSLPRNRAQLFEGFFGMLHDRERKVREDRHDFVPERAAWLERLAILAETLQRRYADASSERERDVAATSLPRSLWPSGIEEMLSFSIDASVLQLVGDDLRFAHQMLQEALASRALHRRLAEGQPAVSLWPADRWWHRNGWEVAAELACESLAYDEAALQRMLGWLAAANPDVACEGWQRVVAPALPAPLLEAIATRWAASLTSTAREPAAQARAAIGRLLGGLGLDRRTGIGLDGRGLPVFDWVRIESAEPFTFQRGRHQPLPAFEIARYPTTHLQFQAFIHGGGYEPDAPWWDGLAHRYYSARDAAWSEPNAPRERVSWYEAVAFCRWLSHLTGRPHGLPPEQQWECAARGSDARLYPWGLDYAAGHANCNESRSELSGGVSLGRTSAVGIYPAGASADGVLDLAGNVWEWCMNEFGNPRKLAPTGDATRVLRGGSWVNGPKNLRTTARDEQRPEFRGYQTGFRVCRAAKE